MQAISRSELDEIELKSRNAGILPFVQPLVDEIRRLQEPQASPGVDELLKPFEDELSGFPDAYREAFCVKHTDAISRVRTALTAPSPFERLEAWMREAPDQRWVKWMEVDRDGTAYIQMRVQMNNPDIKGTGTTLAEAVADALKKAEGK